MITWLDFYLYPHFHHGLHQSTAEWLEDEVVPDLGRRDWLFRRLQIT